MTRRKSLALLRIQLPAGVFKIERLSFTPAPPIVEEASPSPRQMAACMAEGSTVRLDRLEGCDQAAIIYTEKPIWLKPQEISLIRCTDVSYTARAAFYETRDQLKAIRRSAPAAVDKLNAVFRQGDPYVSGLTGGGHSTLKKRLGCIHRLLLLNAQAHSMVHNLQERKSANAESGAAIMGSIERLNDALAETSAALLGLVPQVRFTLDSDKQSHELDDGGQQTSLVPNNSSIRSATVTFALANTGQRDVDLVKIGLDINALPPDVQCEPGDPAMFGTLRPGQTVRAVFAVRWTKDTAMNTRRCVGDVSYFVGSAPAHLRLRPW